MKHWLPTKNSKYFMPKEEFLTALHYALRYASLRDQYDNLCADTSKGIRYDLDKVQISPTGDEVEKLAIRRAELKNKIDKIEKAIELAEDNEILREYLKKGVCFGLTYKQLQHIEDVNGNKGIPCGKDLYYEHRRRFYWELSKMI